MNVILISNGPELISVGERLKDEGHRVGVLTHSDQRVASYRHRENVIETVLERGGRIIPAAFDKIMDELAPTVGIGSIGVGRYVEEFKRRGVKMWGGGIWADATHIREDLKKAVNAKLTVPLHFNDKGATIWDGDSFNSLYIYKEFKGFMNKGIGPQIVSGISAMDVSEGKGFGVFIPPDIPILKKAPYIGQVRFGEECGIGFSLPHFALSVELWGSTVGKTIQWPPIHYKYLHAYAVLCSMFWGDETDVLIPMEMRKHVWVMGRGETSDMRFAWVTAAGASSGEARGRVRRTIKNLREMFPEIMYRSDLV